MIREVVEIVEVQENVVVGVWVVEGGVAMEVEKPKVVKKDDVEMSTEMMWVQVVHYQMQLLLEEQEMELMGDWEELKSQK